MGMEVAVLRSGVLAQVAPPEELYRRPVDAALAQFVGEAVLLPGVASAGFAACARWGDWRSRGPAPTGRSKSWFGPSRSGWSRSPASARSKRRSWRSPISATTPASQMSLEADTTPVTVRVAGPHGAAAGDRGMAQRRGRRDGLSPRRRRRYVPIPLASGKPPANEQRAITATN